MAEITDILNEHEAFIIYALLAAAVFAGLYAIYHYAVADPCGAYQVFHRFFGDIDTLNRCGV